ncbi:MAG: TatD family hydrolase [bacterium]
MQLFDTHAHYDDAAFDPDRAEVLHAVHAAGVALAVNPATELGSCEKAKALAERYDWLWFAAGVHPEEADGAPVDYLDRLAPYLAHPKCVAVGEIGLDYHWRQDNKPLQLRLLREQLALSIALKKPVILHERDATGDWLSLIRDFPAARGVMHCFSGSWETAKTMLDLGWYISFTGVVTFKNARKAVEVASKMPLDRLMLETDSPYMSPEPNRGRRNDSRNLVYINSRIAALRGLDEAELAAVTLENGKRFFGIA